MNQKTYKLLVRSAESRRLSWGEMLDVRSTQAYPLRLGKVSFYKTIGNLIGSSLEDHFEAEFLSSGGEQIVLKTDSPEPIVTKVIIDTMGLSPTEAEARATKHQRLSDKCGEYMEDQWTDTVYYASSLPKILGGQAVVAVQPFLKPELSFASAEEVSNYSADEAYANRFRTLVARLRNLHIDWGMLPDIGGPGNIVLNNQENNGPNLQIIDTIPKTGTQHTIVDTDGTATLRVQQQILEDWGAGLVDVTEQLESRELVLHWR